MPGVAVNSDFDGGVSIRGSRPIDNQYFIDFLPVGYLFHLTGLSVLDSDLVDGITMFPASFGAQYEGKVGAIIDVATRSPDTQGPKGMLDVSIFDTGLLLEAPLNERSRTSFSGRVSYYDLLVGENIKKRAEKDNNGLNLIQLPRYYDYRGQYQYDINERSELNLIIDGASDEAELLLGEDSARAIVDPAVIGAHSYKTQYSRQMFLIKSKKNQSSSLQLALGRINKSIISNIGAAGKINKEEHDDIVRVSVKRYLAKSHFLTFGGSFLRANKDYDIIVRDIGCTEFDVECRYIDHDFLSVNSQDNYFQGSLFVEDSFTISNQVNLTLGISWSQDSYLNESAFEPRIRIDFDLNDFSQISIGMGAHHQMPRFEYIEESLGNENLSYLKSKDITVGLRSLLPGQVILKTEAYYKKLKNLVTSDNESIYDNQGEGHAWGAEILLKRIEDPWTNWLAISYSRSIREDKPNQSKFDFEYDQPLIVSFVSKLKLNSRFDLSGRLAYHSGPPYTEILGGKPDPLESNRFSPIYGSINKERLPNYFRIDLRLDWSVKDKINLYFEFINALNRKNVLSYEYNRDFSQTKEVNQLPSFLSFGFEKHW